MKKQGINFQLLAVQSNVATKAKKIEEVVATSYSVVALLSAHVCKSTSLVYALKLTFRYPSTKAILIHGMAVIENYLY
jgi:hypothetical protein